MSVYHTRMMPTLGNKRVRRRTGRLSCLSLPGVSSGIVWGGGAREGRESEERGRVHLNRAVKLASMVQPVA